MRVLVTGGAGFIGSHIVDALLERGHEAVVLDNFSSGTLDNLNGARLEMSVNVFERDVTRPLGVMDVIERAGPFDAICHQAAQPSLRRSLDDPAHDATVNIIGTLNVIAAARACGAHLVFASTSAVYERVPARQIREGDILKPATPYGLAKLAAERYIEMLSPSYTILRYGNVYGSRQVQVGENQLIPHCLAHLIDGKPFAIHGDGQQTRDFVYVKDIARANVLAIEEKPQGVYNCGTGQGASVNEIVGNLRILTGNIDRPVMHDKAIPGEAQHVALDSTRALNAFGWRALTPLAAGLRETIGWWNER